MNGLLQRSFFFQNSWTVYQLLSCSLKTPQQKGNEEMMTTILDRLDSGFSTQSYRESCLNNSLPCASHPSHSLWVRSLYGVSSLFGLGEGFVQNLHRN